MECSDKNKKKWKAYNERGILKNSGRRGLPAAGIKIFVNCAVFGEMQEWFNWHAWKACVPQKGTGGSNPPLSAKA
jgi:hypothetical protein